MTTTTIETIPAPTDVGALANRINFETRDFHNRIDAVMSIKLAISLKHGFIYRQGLLAFYYIFSAIESEIDQLLALDVEKASEEQWQVRGILEQFYMDQFRRKDRLLLDLQLMYYPEFQDDRQAFLQFIDGEESMNKNVELRNFVTYIHDTTLADPCTILAYCHVLYLALFAGGKIMKSNVMKHLGLFPKFKHMSKEETVSKGTNFYKFSEENSTDKDLKLRWEYKKNYELATRTQLTEEQKQKVINTSKDIFSLLEKTVTEIGQNNRNELMNVFSFKILTYLAEEYRYTEKLSANAKRSVLVALVILQLLLVYCTVRMFIS